MFQFMLSKDKAGGPARTTWSEAASDLVIAGHGAWKTDDALLLGLGTKAYVEEWKQPGDGI